MSDGNDLQRSDGCSDWKCASTDGCEPEWWNKQLMWWWRAKSAKSMLIYVVNSEDFVFLWFTVRSSVCLPPLQPSLMYCLLILHRAPAGLCLSSVDYWTECIAEPGTNPVCHMTDYELLRWLVETVRYCKYRSHDHASVQVVLAGHH